MVSFQQFLRAKYHENHAMTRVSCCFSYKKNEKSVFSSFGLDTLLRILFCLFAFSMKVSSSSCFNSFLVFIKAVYKVSMSFFRLLLFTTNIMP